MALPNNGAIKIIECPRDAMQGWQHFITTEDKIRYLNSLLQVGFDILDFGSFVSPKAIPQMRDTKEVIPHLDLSITATKLLAIVANLRGAEEAVQYDEITYLGFPFSISLTFQLRNTNSTIEQSLQTVEAIQRLCLKHRKTLVIYLSMGFGNPYNDEYNADILLQYADEMVQRNVHIISLADTVGLATPEQIYFALNTLIPQYSNVEFGVHLHTTATNYKYKLQAALEAGCSRFDGALKGIGGCPMAQDALVGNMPTEKMIYFFEQQAIPTYINKQALAESMAIASEIFV
ncbi:hydroxymethylglutaryl-CoA lyase [Ilyomonas limi]|uniref:Hydroxymethylglutaryl-CoA lyase n=1 Tax=Ilyomonas limi TaxID=2575867 RepID=A0A4U3KY86_9BACT|nr:hydroxymethylglutaryl-CoA lyase [Ilyomonas limi]TKK66116.1 hydroxymethylglutaryl-CoA lyase [Ilyomonas limi]